MIEIIFLREAIKCRFTFSGLSAGVFLFSFLISLTSLYSQNLVPNPGFEEYRNFQCRFDNSLLQETVNEWFEPINTSTDYWQTEAPEECDLKATQEVSLPRTGSGMIGLITGYVARTNAREYKEYAAVKLQQKMTKGRFYQIRFYAKALTTGVLGQNRVDIMLSNNLAAAFTREKVEETFAGPGNDHLTIIPEVKEKNVLDGSWNKVEYCFLADDDYEYLYIGNFDSYATTTYNFLSSNNLLYSVAYYFIDDVFLAELPYKVSDLENVITYCYDQEKIDLTASTDGALSYLWEDGSTTPNITYDNKTDLNTNVRITFGECIYTHEFDVNYFPPLSLGNDTTLCTGESLLLELQYFRNDFQWSDGSSDLSKTITTSVNYHVSIPFSGCRIEDEIEIKFIDCPGFVPNVITPNGDEKNDFFIIENIENKTWSLKIYNRWGDDVYFSSEYKNEWNGGSLSDGVYYFRLRCESLDKTIVGWVEVLR